MRRSMADWFTGPGAYVLVDGQFGSTGKGLLASYIAAVGAGRITVATTNAGPNSGHTAYWHDFNSDCEIKVMTQQIPVASVICKMLMHPVLTYLNAGAIIDPQVLDVESEKYGVDPFVHPCAALIDEVMRKHDMTTEKLIASTGKGVGPALQRKISRRTSAAIASYIYAPILPEGRTSWDNFWDWKKDVVFVETAQGFSLGINSARFYPHTTSRECTVMQALADARIPADMLRRSVATFRTFPIRVGNTATGYSGNGYADQEETSWEALGLEPELTTVTKRVRRVFTWSQTQFEECISVNRPTSLFLNFCNYLHDHQLRELCQKMLAGYVNIMGCEPQHFMLGFGPRVRDIRAMEEHFG